MRQVSTHPNHYDSFTVNLKLNQCLIIQNTLNQHLEKTGANFCIIIPQKICIETNKVVIVSMKEKKQNTENALIIENTPDLLEKTLDCITKTGHKIHQVLFNQLTLKFVMKPS